MPHPKIFGERRRPISELPHFCSCLNLILACIVYWQGREISRVLTSATRSPMESISPCENTSAPSSGITSCSMASISSTESSSASAVAQKESALAYKITRISLVPWIGGSRRLRSQKAGEACDLQGRRASRLAIVRSAITVCRAISR